jgi:putative membrane protein
MRIGIYVLPPLLALAHPAFAQPQSILPAQYVAAAGAGDLYERTSSEMVLKTTHNARVREFAQIMIAQHTTSSAIVMAAAKRAHLAAKPPHLSPDQQQMITALHRATGDRRDQIYLAEQKTAHDQALSLHGTYAATGSSLPLRAAAAKIKPVVERHIAMLEAM